MSPLNVFLNFGDALPLLATSFKVSLEKWDLGSMLRACDAWDSV